MKKWTMALVAAMLCAASRADLLYWMVDDSNLDAQFTGYAYAGVRAEGAEDHLYIVSEEGEKLEAWGVGKGMFGWGMYADLGEYGEGSSFLVELFDENDNPIGYGTPVEYGDLLKANHIASSVGGTGMETPDAWAASSFAVPEPTSALALLLGTALLTLRRKKNLV